MRLQTYISIGILATGCAMGFPAGANAQNTPQGGQNVPNNGQNDEGPVCIQLEQFATYTDRQFDNLFLRHHRDGTKIVLFSNRFPRIGRVSSSVVVAASIDSDLVRNMLAKMFKTNTREQAIAVMDSFLQGLDKEIARLTQLFLQKAKTLGLPTDSEAEVPQEISESSPIDLIFIFNSLRTKEALRHELKRWRASEALLEAFGRNATCSPR